MAFAFKFAVSTFHETYINDRQYPNCCKSGASEPLMQNGR